MTIEHQRTAHVARSGDTHVIDPTRDHAEAVNVDRAAPEPEAKPSRRRAIAAGPGGVLSDPLTGDGSGTAADPITPEAE
jgi:hypothetical protein